MNESATIVVVTAMNLEYLAVRGWLEDLRSEPADDGTLFEVGRLPHARWHIVLAVSGERNAASQHVTATAIRKYRPRAVLMVGIAGALKTDIALADVVVGTHIYAYHGGRENADGFKAAPRTSKADHTLLQYARHTAMRAAGEDSAAVHFKPIASGEVVMAARSGELGRVLGEHYVDSAAIDMESAGVAAACSAANTPLLVVRGISDHADEKKHLSDDGTRQPAAAAAAAGFATALIRDLPRPQGAQMPKRTSERPGRLGDQLLSARLDGAVHSLCFGPDRTVLAAAAKGPVRRWDYLGGVERPALPAKSWPGWKFGTRVAASQDGGPILVRDGFALRALDPDDPGCEPLPVGTVMPPGYLDTASSGRYAIVSWGTRFELRSVETGRTLRKFSAVTTSLSADGRTLAVAAGLAGGGRTVHVYRLKPGQEGDDHPYRTMSPLHQAAGRGLQIALSPDGALLACVTARWAGVFDVDSGAQTMPRGGDSNIITQTFPENMGLVCTPQQRLLWMNHGKVLQMRDTRQNDVQNLPNRARYRRIAINADGSLLAAGDEDGRVCVWEWHD